MSYRDKTTGQYPISKQEFVSRNPNISLPAAWTDEVLEILGVDYVKPVAKPDITATQRLVEGQPEQREDGQWYQTWSVQDMSAEEVAALVAALKMAACERIEAKRKELERTAIWINWPDGIRSIIQTRDERDWRNINGVASRGLFRLTQGQTDEDWFRDADNVDHVLLPPQAVDMGAQAAAGVSALAKVAQVAKDAISAPVVTTAAQVAEIEAGVAWPE